MAAPARRRLPPGDESASDRPLVRFLEAIRTAARARDVAALQALCAPNVITGIDSPSGPAELAKKMNRGGWAALETVLTLGAARYEKGFVLPYLFEKFPKDLESFEHVVTIRPKAVLRSAPNAGASVVCPLDYDILHVVNADPRSGWIAASRLDGPKGWVAVADVRSLGEPRLFIEKRRGAWRITAWAAGD